MSSLGKARHLRTVYLAGLGVFSLLAAMRVGVVAPEASAQPVRAFTGPFSVKGSLSGVTETSASNIWAVGYAGSYQSAHALIIHWNGRKWRNVPVVGFTRHATLNGITAVSADDMWAVGSTFSTPGSDSALILRWDGKTWQRAHVPSIKGSAVLLGVTATSAHNIWAVGYYFAGTLPIERTLILHWSGRSWRRIAGLPTFDRLNAVAASSADDAWAVGVGGGPAGGPSVALRWNGKSWKQVKTPSPGGRVTSLNGVAYIGKDAAWAVGVADSDLILHWNGRAWKQVPSPSAGTSIAVAVISKTTAWAAGESFASRSFIAKWNGTTWKQAPSPNVAGGSELNGLAAISAGNIWAVGSSGSFTSPRTLILHWNGKNWG